MVADVLRSLAKGARELGDPEAAEFFDDLADWLQAPHC
jgi:hypothetical protein